MKRTTTSLIVAVLISVTFAGCGNQESEGEEIEECQRYELEEFEDCTAEDFVSDRKEVNPYENTTLKDFCESECGRTQKFWVLGSDYRDLRPATGIREVEESFAVESNEHLESLGGLEDLERIGTEDESYAYVKENHSLKSLEGLDSLQHVEGSLQIDWNDDLQSLDGLESLETVSRTLDIDLNKSLTSLRGLESLESVGGNLKISYNESLADCEIDWLVDRVEVEGRIDVNDNGTEETEDCPE